MIARTDELLRDLAAEEHAELAAAVFVVASLEDVAPIVAAGLAAVHGTQPLDLRDALQDASLVVVVDAIDGAMVEHVAELQPAAEIRTVGLPPGCASVCSMLGYRPAGRVTAWDYDVAATARTIWLDWCAANSLPARAASDDDQRPFPVAALPPVLRAIVTEGAAAQGVDVAFWAVPLIGIIAGCIGATRRVRLSADWSEPCVVWTASIAASGSGKSPALRALVEPVRERDYELHLRTLAAQQQHADEMEARKATKGSGGGERLDPPPMLAALLDNATLEAVCVRAADNPRGLLLVVDELAGFLRSFDKYRKGGGDAQAWLSIHNADAVKVDRKSTANGAPARIYVRRCAVSIAGTIQPGIARRYLGDAESRESGMAARLLVAAPRVMPAKWTDREVPPQVRADYARVVAGLLDLRLDHDGDPLVLRLDPGARAAFVEFHDQNGQACADAARGDNEDLAAALSKLRGAAPRIALALTLAKAAETGIAETASTVYATEMHAGIALARWFEGEARRIYAQWIDAEAVDTATAEHGSITVLADRLFEIMATGPRTMRELHARTGNNVPGDRMRAALQVLRVAGRAQPCEPGQGRAGRPAERWERVCS